MLARLMGLGSISPRQLHARAASEGVTIVDVNARQSWLAARVPGARHLDPLTYVESDLPSDKHAPLVFYCSNVLCRKAPIAAQRARSLGYLDVQVMSAGIRGWLRAALPVESGEA
jgi:rhodanese-related sulfurtransferase